MENPPRRTLLGGLGTTIAVAAAGCLSVSGEEDESSASTDTGIQELSDLLGYIPASVGADSIGLNVINLEAQQIIDDPQTGSVAYHQGILEEDATPSQTASLTHLEEDYTEKISVLMGDTSVTDEIEDALETQETDEGVEYDLADPLPANDELVVAVYEEVVLTAESPATIEDALESAADDKSSLREEYSIVEDALETFPDADTHRVYIGQEGVSDDALIDPDDIEFTSFASDVVDEHTIEEKYGIEFSDESVITDEILDEIESDIGTTNGPDEPDIDQDGTLVTATWTRDLEAEQEAREHDSPRFSHRDEIDPDDDSLELEVTQGDPTPVEELTFELDEEEYDEEIWADGQDEIEEGDTMYLDMDDVEPNLQLHLHHEMPHGSSGTGISILSHFQFDFEYDRDDEAVTVTYEDDRAFPLDGDQIHLSVIEDPRNYDPVESEEPHVIESVQPWEGDELSVGDKATISEGGIGDQVLVGWDGDEQANSIANHTINPPGTASFEYDYEAETVTATLDLENSEPADAYELQVDDEPTDVQWADEYETIEDEASITVEDIEGGSRVTAVWVEDDIEIGWTQAEPTLEISLEADDGTLALTHDGGPSLPVSDLTAQIFSDGGSEEIELEDIAEGEFGEGDTVTLDAPDSEAPIDVSLELEDEFHVGSDWLTEDEL